MEDAEVWEEYEACAVGFVFREFFFCEEVALGVLGDSEGVDSLEEIVRCDVVYYKGGYGH